MFAPPDVLDADARLLWHPYASMEAQQQRLVCAAAGNRLTLADGNGRVDDVIDAMSSWWCAIHGYRHPVLDGAAHAQLDQFSHVMFGGLTHEPAVALAQRLVEMTAEPLRHVFFSDSGSVAVEVALKMALQSQYERGELRRTKILTVRGGYHGDTFGAMSVCDPVDGMHALFDGIVAQQLFAPRPPAGFDRATDDPEFIGWTEDVTALAMQQAGEIAAIVVEPVLQGAGGMHVYSPECLRILRKLANEHGFVLIFDEIATGFGRTGMLFAGEYAGVTPDILCVGKALTGGYLSLAATLCTSAIADAIAGGPGGALMHGPTFMANPLACAVAVASLDLLLADDWRATVAGISAGLRTGLAEAAELPGVQDVRVIGAVGVIQLDHPVDVPRVTHAAIQRGVWIRPFRDLVYTMPPYISTGADIATITAALVGAVAEAGAQT